MRIIFKALIYIILASVTVGIVSGLIGRDSQSIPAPEKPKQEKNKFGNMIASCQVEWEMSEKKKLHNPSSLDWDHRSAELGMYKKKTPVISVPYRATNALGATVLNQALCKIDADTGKIIAVIK